jgi:hypothetical protein
MYNYNPQLLLTDDWAPACCKLTQAERKLAWERNPPKPMPDFGFERTATQIAYAESIAADKRKQRAKDEVRWAELKARKAAEKAELTAAKAAIQAAIDLSHVRAK